MTAAAVIADVQGAADARNIAIDYVGVKNLRHPIRIADRSGEQNTVAVVQMYVALPPQQKGAHMSRFVDILNRHEGALSVANFGGLLAQLRARLGAQAGRIELTFPYFVSKRAPVSAAHSLMDYEVTLLGEIAAGEAADSALKIVAPVTSLCPCSKAIADYGAHNQRAHITVEIRARPRIGIEELIAMVEGEACAELYGLLKRPDEKFITERAYDNPKFVEDVARDLAGVFNADSRITSYSVSVENFESIHNHSAYAQINRDKTAG